MQSVLTDALGSTLALADASSTLTTQYTYDPFGATTVSGAPSDNAIQYTGRENDGTGLHYYRARYYNPALQRFLSQDPLGFGGGDVNLYGYVGNSPTNFTDPSGEILPALLFGCAVGAAWGDGIVWHVAGRKADVGDYLRVATAGCATGLLVSAGVVAVAGLITGSGLVATAEAAGAGTIPLAQRVASQLSDPRLGSLQGQLTIDDIQDLVRNPNALRVFDNRTGNINVIQKINEVYVRVTMLADESKIISVGRVRENQIRNLLANGKWVRLP